MAEKKLKSIKFPNLPDTYIIPELPFSERVTILAEGENVAFTANETYDGMVHVEYQIDTLPTIGSIATVIWDGETYSTQVADSGGGYPVIAHPDLLFMMIADDIMGDGVLRLVIYDYLTTIAGGSSSTHSFSVSCTETVKIEQKFVPNADWDMNDLVGDGFIKNKPFGKTLVKTITWDGNIAGKETIVVRTKTDGTKCCLCKVAEYDGSTQNEINCVGYTVTGYAGPDNQLLRNEGKGSYSYHPMIDAIGVYISRYQSLVSEFGIPTSSTTGFYFMYLEKDGVITNYTSEASFYKVEGLPDCYYGTLGASYWTSRVTNDFLFVETLYLCGISGGRYITREVVIDENGFLKVNLT